jgi:hypothetical protein
MKFHQTLLILLLAIVVTGCFTFGKKHEDPFYNDAGTYDSGRLPLLNPYYLVYIDEQYAWQMPIKGNFPDDQYSYNGGDLLEVTKVAVENGVIMVYTPRIRSVDESVGQKVLHWFVMIPSNKNFEMGFDSETELLNYLQEFGIGEPHWVDPSAAYEEFSKSGCLSWVPDCS